MRAKERGRGRGGPENASHKIRFRLFFTYRKLNAKDRRKGGREKGRGGWGGGGKVDAVGRRGVRSVGGREQEEREKGGEGSYGKGEGNVIYLATTIAAPTYEMVAIGVR